MEYCESSVCDNDIGVYWSMNDFPYNTTVITKYVRSRRSPFVVCRFSNIGPKMNSVVSTFAVLVATIVLIDAGRKDMLYSYTQRCSHVFFNKLLGCVPFHRFVIVIMFYNKN